MEKDQTLLEILEDQKRMELKLAKILEESPVKSVAQCIVKALALDSLKHALLYQALIDLQKEIEFVSDLEKATILDTMKKHAKDEEDVLEKINSLVEEISDPRVKSVMKHIAIDEYRHHRVLEDFVEALTLKEQEYDIIAYEWIKSL